MWDIFWDEMPLAGAVCLSVCASVFVRVFLSRSYFKRVPRASARSQPAQVCLSSADLCCQIFFLLCISHQQLNWGEKVNLKHKSSEKKSNYFSRCFLHQCSCHVFLSFSFVISSFSISLTRALMVSDPRIKFGCQKKCISYNTSCHDEPMSVPVLQGLLCGCLYENTKCLIDLYLFIMAHFKWQFLLCTK